MTDRPILFGAPMVRALLEGRKTQTRRVLKGGWQPILNAPHDVVKTWFAPPEVPALGVPNQWAESGIWAQKHGPAGYNRFLGIAPYRPGDRLWVKETWNIFNFSQDGEAAWPLLNIPSRQEFEEVRELAVRSDWQIIYRESDRARKWFADQKWRVSIHMPRWASRLTLLVTDVRVERLQDVSRDDAIAEGVHRVGGGMLRWENWSAAEGQSGTSPQAAYALLWNSINGPDAWDANPWVVAVTFTVEQRNIDA